MLVSHETEALRLRYARGDVNTNSAEGFFGVFKKGMKGVYQHCSEKHLNRYEPPRVCRRLFGLSYAAIGCSASMAW